MLEFNRLGYLEPNRAISSDINELEKYFVIEYSSVERSKLFEEYLRYSKDLKELFGNYLLNLGEMEKEKLYRLMDVLDEIKEIDELILKHESQGEEASSLMIDQYKARKDQLLTYFINEINASAENRSSRLSMIKIVMERFYTENKEDKTKAIKVDKNFSSLVNALSA